MGSECYYGSMLNPGAVKANDNTRGTDERYAVAI
jgi:hypothetical protein